MREIKFRFGWYALKDIRDLSGSREWVFEYYTLEELIGGAGTGETFSAYKSRDEYTGLKDKNGKEIYEGDIVDYCDKGHLLDSGIYEVVFQCGKFYPISELYYEKYWPKSWGAEHTCKIIGNIYENPELLGKEE